MSSVENVDPILSRLLELANVAASIDEIPVSAIIFRGGKILSEAINLRESLQQPTAHAEVLAIQYACAKTGQWRLNDFEIAVLLEPCNMCMAVLEQARIHKLTYFAENPKKKTCDMRHKHPLIEISFKPTPEASIIIKDFFKKLRSDKKGEELWELS